MKEHESNESDGILPKTDTPGLAHARKVVVGIVGFTVLIVGVCLLVLPGPAFIVIPAGLAILATEFVWARRWLRKAKQTLKDVKRSYTGSGEKSENAKTKDASNAAESPDGRS